MRYWISRFSVATLLIVLALPLYSGLATKGSMYFQERPRLANYDMLGRAILAGRLSVARITTGSLPADADPRNPAVISPPVDDLVVHDDKYYVLQEPLPGLLHAAWIGATGLPLPTGIMVVLFACGSLVLMAIIVSEIRSVFFPDTPEALTWAVVFCFAFSGAHLYLVSRPLIYHETIAAAQFFMLFGALFFFRAIARPTRTGSSFALAGLFFGAAVASKVSMVFYPICFWLLYGLFELRQKGSFKRIALHASYFAALFVWFGFLLLAYNYFRFADAFDFGRTHVVLPNEGLYRYCILEGNFLRLAHVPYNIANYLITVPSLVWWHSLPVLLYPIDVIGHGDMFIVSEQIGALFLMVPALLLCLPLPFILGKCSQSNRLHLMIMICFIASMVTFLFYCLLMRAVPRYLAEFTPLTFVLVYCTLTCLWKSLGEESSERRAFLVLVVLLLLANTIMGGYLGINGVLDPV